MSALKALESEKGFAIKEKSFIHFDAEAAGGEIAFYEGPIEV